MLEIFSYSFMVRAFIAGGIIGLIAPLIGNFLVIRRYAYMADTLAHVSLVGIAGALLMGIDPFFGTVCVTLLASVGIEKLRKTYGFFGESLLALFLSGSLAIAVMMISVSGGTNADLFGFLFGSITSVSWTDIAWATALGGVIITMTIVYRETFLIISFDEDLARGEGIQTEFFNTLMMVIAALTISIGVQIVGALLIGALMVIPTITALVWKKSFLKTMMISMIVSEIAVISGIFASYLYDLPTGATIVIITIFIFVLSLITSEKI